VTADGQGAVVARPRSRHRCSSGSFAPDATSQIGSSAGRIDIDDANDTLREVIAYALPESPDLAGSSIQLGM
jgi:hypothetical protein